MWTSSLPGTPCGPSPSADRLPDLYGGDKFPGKEIAVVVDAAGRAADRAVNATPSVPVTRLNRPIATAPRGKLADRRRGSG